MNDETKKKINEKYERELQRGERFWPDSIFKDAIMAFGIFLLLMLLATFVGVPNEPKADPSANYTPRPEWYFLFLFKFLAIYGQIPLLGKIEWIATVLIPGAAILVLTLLPFLDKSPLRYYGKRILPISVMGIFVVSMVQLTLLADVALGGTDAFGLLRDALQTIGGLVIPLLAYITLFVMGLALKSSTKAMIWTAGATAALMIALTGAVLMLAPAPATQETTVANTLADQILAGQDLYAVNCVECHGDDGKVIKIEGVKGLEGKEIMPIHSSDVLYTLNDAAIAEIISYGRPDAGMNPFGKAYNPQGLSTSEIDYIVTFMRYMWDGRFEVPAEALKPLFPPLAEGEVPSYDIHIAPIVKRYCLACHRAGKENNNFLMTSWQEILSTGDNKDHDVIARDEKSYLLQVIQGQAIPDPKDPNAELIGTMPPTSNLKPNIVDVFKRWVLAGMPQTAADAAAIQTATPGPTATPKP